jgi:hypothetical protein
MWTVVDSLDDQATTCLNSCFISSWPGRRLAPAAQHLLKYLQPPGNVNPMMQYCKGPQNGSSLATRLSSCCPSIDRLYVPAAATQSLSVCRSFLHMNHVGTPCFPALPLPNSTTLIRPHFEISVREASDTGSPSASAD